jgi:hypothetical protein
LLVAAVVVETRQEVGPLVVAVQAVYDHLQPKLLAQVQVTQLRSVVLAQVAG